MTIANRLMTSFGDVAEAVLRMAFVLPRNAKVVDNVDALYRDDSKPTFDPAKAHRDFAVKMRADDEDRRRRGWSRNQDGLAHHQDGLRWR